MDIAIKQHGKLNVLSKTAALIMQFIYESLDKAGCCDTPFYKAFISSMNDNDQYMMCLWNFLYTAAAMNIDKLNDASLEKFFKKHHIESELKDFIRNIDGYNLTKKTN